MEPKFQWVIWIYFHCTTGVNSTYFHGNPVAIYQVWYIWIHIRRNIEVGGTCIQKNICIGRDFIDDLLSGHTWTTSSYVNGFSLCPRNNFKLCSKKSGFTIPDTWMTVNLHGGDNSFWQIFALKLFSTGNLSLGISQEISPFLNSMELCPYPFNRTSGVRIYVCWWLQMYFYQGIDPTKIFSNIWIYIAALHESEPNMFLNFMYI